MRDFLNFVGFLLIVLTIWGLLRGVTIRGVRHGVALDDNGGLVIK